jgi:cytochrome c biogenesis protein CcdA
MALLLSLSVLFVPDMASASSGLVEMIGREGCTHCADEEVFLSALAERRPGLEIRVYDAETGEGKAVFEAITATEGISKATPITAVGGTIIQGFESDETTGRRIEALLDAYPGAGGFEEILGAIGSPSVEQETGSTCEGGDICLPPNVAALEDSDQMFVSLPFLGSTDVSRYSLPALAGVLGFVDGFNPCALWVLVTFLLVLLQIGDRAKMFLVAGLFILAEAIMYFLILNIWFSAWDFIGLDHIVTPIVGLLALGGGTFFLYEWKFRGGTCSVANMKQRATIASKVREFATKPITWVTIGGVVLLAFSVNVIEFACSVGIPQAFTKILELNDLEFLPRQGLLLLYTLAYMVDDLIVFGIALAGAAQLGKTQAYAKWCNLFGGMLMILLGLLLLFRPEKLLF